VLHLLLESQVSELYARQNAMRNATDNAENMIEQFTLDYNKARQSSITQEIIEIVNGAEALKG
jgi:F-type H+-transporting ATPase subunit gamma